jgi:hypothetical protein
VSKRLEYGIPMKSGNDEGKYNFRIQYSKFHIRYSKEKKKSSVCPSRSGPGRQNFAGYVLKFSCAMREAPHAMPGT